MEQGPEKPEKSTTPSVAIDGSRIRNIREAKKLTQLYVASVVGVTTDTISRWENNRYPSIKRDNAEKLARALEVELSEILRQEEFPSSLSEPSAPPASPRRGVTFWFLSAITALVIIFVAVFLLTRPPVPAPSATRWAPYFAAPNEVVPVQIKITRHPGETAGFIVKERLPDGFHLVSSIPPKSAIDPAGTSVKWLIPAGNVPVTISYTVRVPAPPVLRKAVRLRGEIVASSGGRTRTEEIGGNSSVQIGPYHWADTNGDGRIDDDEIMPAYYICDEMKGLGLNWKTIEDIWSGKGYRWDPKSGFTVIK